MWLPHVWPSFLSMMTLLVHKFSERVLYLPRWEHNLLYGFLSLCWWISHMTTLLYFYKGFWRSPPLLVLYWSSSSSNLQRWPATHLMASSHYIRLYGLGNPPYTDHFAHIEILLSLFHSDSHRIIFTWIHSDPIPSGHLRERWNV